MNNDNITITDFVRNGAGFKTGFSNFLGSDQIDELISTGTIITPDQMDPANPKPGTKLSQVKTLDEVVVVAKKKPTISLQTGAAASGGSFLQPQSGKSISPWLLIGGIVLVGTVVTIAVLKAK